MRLWSLHPKYLDAKGLVALWREALLAKNVLEGNTKGYKHHPQLDRFRKTSQPIKAINFYLKAVWEEAKERNYRFDPGKFVADAVIDPIQVTSGQLNFEKDHLFKKLLIRDEKRYQTLINLRNFEIHPLFQLIEGDIEPWEKI